MATARDLQVDVLVNARADTAKARAEIGSFAREMRRDIEKAIKALPDIKLDADSSDAQVEIAAIRAQLKDLSKQRIGIDVDPALARAQIDDLRKRLATLAKESPDIQVQVDSAAALKALGTVESAVKAVDGKTADVHVDAHVTKALIDIGRVRTALDGIGMSPLLAAGLFAGAGAGGAAVGGALAAVGSLGLAGGVAAAALHGTADAVKAYDDAVKAGKNDFKDFNKILTGMAPAQQAFVRELIATKAPLSALQKTAANSFLPGLTEGLKGALTLFPVVDAAVARTGGIMGDTARRLAELFKTKQFQDDLDAWQKSTDGVTGAIGDMFVSLTGRLVQFGREMTPAAEGLAKFISGISDGLSGFLDKLAPHAQSFERVFTALGRIAAQVLPLIGTIAGDIADELAPVLESVAGFLERNRGALEAWAPALGAMVLALGGLRIASGLAGLLSPVATAISAIVKAAAGHTAVSALGTSLGGLGKTGGIAWGQGFLGGLALVGVGVGATIILDKILPKDAAVTHGSQVARDMLAEMARVFQGGGTAFQTLDVARWISNPISMAVDVGVRELQRLFGFASSGVPPITFDVNTGPAQAQVVSFMNGLKGQAGTVNIDGRTEDATQALAEFIQRANADPGAKVMVNGDLIPIQDAIALVVGQINSQAGTVTVNGDTVPAGDALQGFLQQAQGSTATVSLDANRDPADHELTGFLAAANASTATSHLNAETSGANAGLAGWVGSATGTTATSHLDAESSGATGITLGWQQAAAATTGTAKLSANPAQANSQTSGWQGRANATTGTAKLVANTSTAESQLNYAARNRTATVTMVVRSITGSTAPGAGAHAMGGIVTPMDQGGMLGMASGGRLTPMSNIAQIVRPNTWRIVGDRMKDSESYIPINSSARSRQILSATAAAMGFNIAPRSAAFDSMPRGRGGDGGALLAAVQGLRSEIHALRGDVDHHGDNADISGRLAMVARLLARGESAAVSAQSARTSAVLGAW